MLWTHCRTVSTLCPGYGGLTLVLMLVLLWSLRFCVIIGTGRQNVKQQGENQPTVQPTNGARQAAVL